MNSRLLAEDRRHIAAGLALGLWAAAIAVVPGLLAKGLLLAPALLLPFAWWLLSARNRWVMVFFAAALLLPPLPFAMGNSGPHPSLLVAGIGVLAGLLWLPEWRIPIDSLPASLLTLSLALAASVAQAALYSGATVAAASLARVALFGISVYVFFYTVCGSTTTTAVVRDVRRLYWMAAAAALFACVDFYFQLPAPAGYGAQFVWLDSGVYRRAQGLFYEASTLGNFCVFFLVMIAAGLQQGSAAILSRKAMLAGGIVLFAALLLSYS
ncbi:MAG TPA: hypothetical protein VG672_09090, partial [Bryobacteraceae bacterium]|nr:hypothetical protein [Bryobacteraceae bacterium]